MKISPGTFGTEVIDGVLHLSGPVHDWVQEFNAQSAQDVMGWMTVYSRYLAQKLGWTLDEVRQGVVGLREQLRETTSIDERLKQIK